MGRQEERRARPRAAVKGMVKLYADGETTAMLAMLRDINCRGAYCISPRPLQCGAAVEIEVCLPPELDAFNRRLRVACKGVVVRTEDLGAGRCGFGCSFREYCLTGDD